MAHETPLDRQWQYLEEVRNDSDEATGFKIPASRPPDERLRELTCEVLKAQKGDGGAARLIAHCLDSELPATPRTFLENIYARFPRPKRSAKTAPAVTGTDWLDTDTKGAEEGSGV